MIRFLCLVLCFLTCPGIAVSADLSPGMTAHMDALLQDWAKKPEVPSVILRVEDTTGVIYANAKGQVSFTNAAPVMPDASFRSASVGKLFTAAVVLRLFEKGILDLDHSISRYLEPSLVNRLHIYKGINYGSQITVRQLLSHTSGLPNTDDDRAFGKWLMQYPEMNRKPEALLEYAINAGPKFIPGKGQQYSSPGYTLLGMIIASAAKKPYHQVVREQIFNPLGLNDTFEQAHELPGHARPVHSYIEDYDMNRIHPSMEFADGGFVTTTADLTKFGLALAQGKLFQHKTTLASALKPYGEESIGLGPFVGWDSSGPSFFYHPGHWGVLLYVDIDRQRAIVYTVNQGAINYADFLEQVLEILGN